MPGDSRQSTLAALRLILRLTGRTRLVWLGVLMIVSSLTEGIGLLILIPITSVIAGENSLGALGKWMAPLAGIPVPVLLLAIVVLVVVRALLVFLVLQLRASMGLAMTRAMRIEAQDAVMAAEWRWLSSQTSSSHAARIIGEADRVGHLGEEALSVVTALVTAVMLMAAAFAISWKLTMIALASAAVVVLAVVALRTHRHREGERYSEIYEALQEQVSNGLFHLRAARIGGAEEALTRQFSETARALEEAELRNQRSIAMTHVSFQAVAVGVLCVLVYIALLQMRLPLSILVPVLAIMVRFVPVATGLQQSVRNWRFNRPALDALKAMVAEAQANREVRNHGAVPPRLTRAITLRRVTMQYAGRDTRVFDQLDLTIRAGSVVGICGPSGVGKSSLADILGGLISPDSGEVLIDDQPLAGGARIAWRQRVAYVEQVPYLFNGTVAENLAWGRDNCDETAIRHALERASASFVFALPSGLNTRVGEGGRQFSGGERQRLALARALLRSPDLLILDEVTAALDGGNEAAVTGTIAALKGSCTILILGHRAALLELADQIVDLGSHADSRRPDA
ncbi:MAG: ATP-binding cassette domain-containing protein [Novosphingobium sp.]